MGTDNRRCRGEEKRIEGLVGRCLAVKLARLLCSQPCKFNVATSTTSPLIYYST